ncbi:hypothetical protein ALC53_06056, partial [Atta colombica]
FVDLQGFIVNKKFIVKEVAVLKQGTVLTHYIFSRGLRWKDGMVPYNEMKRLITAVFEHDVIVYVKGHEKRTWLWNYFWTMSGLQNVLKIYNWWLQKNFLNKKYVNTYLLHISFFPSFIIHVLICMNVYV